MPAGAPPEQIDRGRVGLLGAGVVAQLVESAGEHELGDAELSRDGGIGQQRDRVARDLDGQLGVAALERQPRLVDFQVALEHRTQTIAVQGAGRLRCSAACSVSPMVSKICASPR